MKVTFVEELEHRKAFRNCMYCNHCNSYKFIIHHQLEPAIRNSWWVECWNCGCETIPAATREDAIERWKRLK